MRNLIIAGQAKNIPIFVRVPKNDEVFIKKALDAGADGLIIPMINSRQDALDAKDNSYYPPIGKRDVGLSRAQGYRNNFDNYIKWSSENLTIIAQIEHIDAINNLEEIVEATLKSDQKTILIVIYNSQNQKRYIGVKLD